MKTVSREKPTVNLAEVFRKFFALLGMNPAELRGEDEGLVDLIEVARKRFAHSSKSENEVLKWLFKRWQKYFSDEASWKEGEVILRAIFVEGLGWSEIAYFTGMHVAQLRALSLRALARILEFSNLENRESRDCARNDIYLIDVLSHQKWKDPLDLNSEKNFFEHEKVCSRCSSLYQKSKSWITLIQDDKLQSVSFGSLQELAEARDHVGSTYELLIKSVFGFAIVLAVILAIPHVPKMADIGNMLSNIGSSTSKNTLSKQNTEASLESPQKDLSFEEVPEVLTKADLVLEKKFETPNTMPVVKGLATKAESGKAETAKVEKPKIEVAKVAPVEQTPKVVTKVELPSKKEPLEVSKASKVVLAPDAKKPPVSDSKVSSDSTETAENPPIGNNLFFRWGARAEDPERLRQKILDVLTEYEVSNISELAMGSLYRGGQYFHFTVKKKDYPALVEKIRALSFTEFTVSPSKGSKEISDSLSRIVFWVGPSE